MQVFAKWNIFIEKTVKKYYSSCQFDILWFVNIETMQVAILEL